MGMEKEIKETLYAAEVNVGMKLSIMSDLKRRDRMVIRDGIPTGGGLVNIG
jgi:hypothetical protein